MRRFGPTAVPGGRSEKGVGIAGGRLGELFHRDVARARVDPQLGAGDAALEPVGVRQGNPSIQLAPLDEDRQLQLAHAPASEKWIDRFLEMVRATS